ncbi:DUF2891 domain-containing protein [Sphingomonas sp. BIUV-7]|uniref:DUF2891 domain-containing protein n=1 Tax=Sphingomonas natans TaxID=3063330 RepID=A0ABT8YBZ3_9SPHN|nr:DUF2891 domain-containing protein [Sphingomonas sp. BIUV-7]MDO6415512.1 DUF2891 domain-containing protein [Sphingomonas sp. BIUV-7]
MIPLTPETAAAFARLTLGHIGRQYPYKLDHVMLEDKDAVLPRVLHPIFHGSFDWHSCVHGWWQLLTVARLHPDTYEAGLIRARADEMLVPEKVAGELAYLARPLSAGFERPYGWAWLLALHQEAARHPSGWGDALAPLASAFATRFGTYLSKLTYPLRVGAHGNSAFALIHASRWAREYDRALLDLIRDKAIGWYSGDRAAQAWEPAGDDFLSGTLCEALLMSELLEPGAFRAWFDAFLPDVAHGEPATLFTPAFVHDRTDPKIAHLDGLNLSRAWCWRTLAGRLGPDHPASARALEAADFHFVTAMPHISGDYAGEHWLATFALLALTA